MQKEKDIQYFMSKVIATFGEGLKKYEPDFDLPYILFGSFALLFTNMIKEKDINKQDYMMKAKEIIEEMASVNTEEVNDLFMVGFLEVFADDPDAIKYSRVNFSRSVNDSLDKILKYWNRI